MTAQQQFVSRRPRVAADGGPASPRRRRPGPAPWRGGPGALHPLRSLSSHSQSLRGEKAVVSVLLLAHRRGSAVQRRGPGTAWPRLESPPFRVLTCVRRASHFHALKLRGPPGRGKHYNDNRTVRTRLRQAPAWRPSLQPRRARQTDSLGVSSWHDPTRMPLRWLLRLYR